MRTAALAVLALLAVRPALGQGVPADTLGAVLVEAAPFALAPSRAPLALTARTRTEAEVATDPAVGLDAVLAGLPGVWVSDRESYAQGERVLVRGLGWRAAFGVRGTHVVLDGVPLTLADGQTQLNVVDPALVRRAEVVRGPASTFWGSGAGGVVALSTEAGPGAPRVRVRALGGAYGLASASVAVRPDLGAGRRLAAWGSYLGEDGYRDHGAVRQGRAGVSGGAAVGGGEVSVVGLLAVVPRAESPGGITDAAFREDPRQTREIVVDRDASKALVQGHVSASYARPVGGVRLRATATGGARTLDNPIVPRYIQLDRATGGLRVTAEPAGRRGQGGAGLAWGLGVEGEVQRDDRLETSNDGGRPGPDVLTDQVETVRSGAVFGRLSAPLGAGVTATAAVRADALGYRAEPAGGAGETRVLGALSPSLGVAARWRAGPLAGTAYANAAGALDAPTTTELGNRPGGLAGFNPDLRPERTWGAEAGARATAPVGGGALGLDLAVFAASVRDLLVPFEEGDVTFYRNEGRTRHVGVEAGLQPVGLGLAGGRLDGAVSYAWTRARFAEGAGGLAVEGNAVPGVPEHLATGTLTWAAPLGGGLQAVLGVGGEAASAYVADSANELAVDGYAVLHLRAALAGLRVGGATASPFVAVRNVGDVRYAGSVVVNAFGGRYVEPGAGRHVQAGVSVALD